MTILTFPHAVPVVSPHDQTIRVQRAAFASALRNVRRTRDTWRKRANRSEFTAQHHHDRADNAQAVAYYLRFHVRLTVPDRPR